MPLGRRACVRAWRSWRSTAEASLAPTVSQPRPRGNLCREDHQVREFRDNERVDRWIGFPGAEQYLRGLRRGSRPRAARPGVVFGERKKLGPATRLKAVEPWLQDRRCRRSAFGLRVAESLLPLRKLNGRLMRVVPDPVLEPSIVSLLNVISCPRAKRTE